MPIFDEYMVFLKHFNLFAHVLVLFLDAFLNLRFEEVNHVMRIPHLRYKLLEWLFDVIPLI